MAFFQVIGAGCGGTSLIMGLLDAHPRCEMIGEQLSYRRLRCFELEAEPEQLPWADRVALRTANYVADCEAEASLRPSVLFGHKTTTEHVGSAANREPDRPPPLAGPEREEAGRIFARGTASVPTVFITRDARTCVPSKMRRADMRLPNALSRWRYMAFLVGQFRNLHPRLHVVKMEDLVSRPDEALTAIAVFLGLDYTDAMLRGTQSEKMKGEYRRDGLDAAVIRLPSPESWHAEVRDDLVALGYPV